MEISQDSLWNIGLHFVEISCVSPQRAWNLRAAPAHVSWPQPVHKENLLELKKRNDYIYIYTDIRTSTYMIKVYTFSSLRKVFEVWRSFSRRSVRWCCFLAACVFTWPHERVSLRASGWHLKQKLTQQTNVFTSAADACNFRGCFHSGRKWSFS